MLLGRAATNRGPRCQAVFPGSGPPSSAGQDAGGGEPGGGQGSAAVPGSASGLYAHHLPRRHASLGFRGGRLAGAGGAEFRGTRRRPGPGLSATDRPVPAARREPPASCRASANALSGDRDVGPGYCPGIRPHLEHRLRMTKPRPTTQHSIRSEAPLASPYEGLALLADPIHRYILFTVPKGDRSERTEKDIIDTPWVQRLRRIHQLQSTWWVYPSGEHSRFQHVLGTMHMAGLFGRHLYPSLRERFGKDLPSEPFIEELLRIAGLLHDVGHGPFGHFFDDHFLQQFRVSGERLNHEILGMAIITKKLGRTIKALR